VEDQALGRGEEKKKIDLDFKPRLPFGASSALGGDNLAHGLGGGCRKRQKNRITAGDLLPPTAPE